MNEEALAVPITDDAFGHALLECFESGGRPGVTAQIIERDDGFIESNDMALYFTPYASWSPLDRWACAAVSGRVLDVGVGAGRHALWLQEQGCRVVGLDPSPLSIEVCRKRGLTDLFVGTLEELAAAKPEPFDAFVLLGNNLGLLRDRQHAPRFFSTLAALARPGALLAGTCIDPYKSSRDEHTQYHAANRAAGRMGGQVRIRIRYRRMATPWWPYLFCSIEELWTLVAGTPWQIEDNLSDDPVYAVRMRLTS